MSGAAMLPAVTGPTSTHPQAPMLLINGAPAPDLRCSTLIAEGLLDERSVMIDASRGCDALDAASARRMIALVGERAEARWLLARSDDAVLDERFVGGTLRRYQTELRAAACEHGLVLRDAWSERLDVDVEGTWWSTDSDVAGLRLRSATMRVGPSGNRSRTRVALGRGRSYVFAEDGVPWRLRDAITYLNLAHGLALDQVLVPVHRLDGPLNGGLTLAGRVRDVLRRLVESEHLVVDRTHGDAEATYGHRLRPLERGRPIRLALDDRSSAKNLVEAFRATVDRARSSMAVRIEPPREVVETFDMLPTWDPALEGESPDAYDRTAADFLLRAGVYRRWRLGEAEGALNLRTLFGGLDIAPQPMALRPRGDGGPCDPTHGVLIEYSLDGGGVWTHWAGHATLARRRGELVLTDDALPTGFASAGNVGTLRLRVTASLRSPDSARTIRILGNVLLDDHDAREGEWGRDGSGRHEDDEDDEPWELPDDAEHDEAPDEDEHHRDGWTGRQAGAAHGVNRGGEVTVDLGPVDPGLLIGDRIVAIRGGRSPTAVVTSVGPLAVVGIEHDLGTNQRTRLRLRAVQLTR
jgi:hypothetical protein